MVLWLSKDIMNITLTTVDGIEMVDRVSAPSQVVSRISSINSIKRWSIFHHRPSHYQRPQLENSPGQIEAHEAV